MQPSKDNLEELLDRAVNSITSAYEETPVPTGLIERTKAIVAIESEPIRNSFQLASAKTLSSDSKSRWTSNKWAWSSWAIAASVLLALGFLTVQLSSPSHAFAAVLDNIRNAATVKLKISLSTNNNSPTMSSIMFIDDQKMRMEVFDGQMIIITDLQKRKALSLDTTSKKADTGGIDDRLVNDMARPFEQLRAAKSKDAKWVGDETIDGRKTEIFDVQNGKILGSTGIPLLRVWVDRESQLPVKIVAEDRDPKSEMRITLEHIEWNVPLESSLFAMEIPEGYTEELKKDVVPTTELAKTVAPALDGSVLIATDRVPRALVWSSFNNRLTVLATDPENVAPQKSKRNEIRQYDMLTNKQLSSIERSTGSEVASTKDGGTIAYAIGREVQIVSNENEKVVHKIVSRHVLPSLALSQSGKLLVTGSTDWQAERKKASPIGFIEVWNVLESTKLLEIPDDSAITFVAISPNEETFLTGSNNGVLKLRSIETGEMLHQFDGYQRAAYSPDNTQLAVALHMKEGETTKNSIAIYSLNDFKLVRSSKMPQVKSTILSLKYSADGKRLAAGSWDGRLFVFDLSKPQTQPWIQDLASGIHSVAFSMDGNQLVTGSEDGGLRLWTLPR